MDEALHSIGLALAVSDSLKEEPNTISQLNRTGFVADAGKCLAVVANRASISEPAARRLHKIAAGLDFSNSNKTAFEAEQAQRILLVVYYKTHGKLPDSIGEMIDTFPTPARMQSQMPKEMREAMGIKELPAPLPSSVWAQKYFWADSLYTLREWAKMIADSGKPFRETASVLPSGQETEEVPPQYQLAAIELRMFHRFPAREKAMARLALCQAILALSVYKGKHGEYPNSLTELAQDTGLAIADDPFSGKPLVYRTKDKGYTLYSIGDDLVDNGGAERQEPSTGMPGMPAMPGPPGVPMGRPAVTYPDVVVKVNM